MSSFEERFAPVLERLSAEQLSVVSKFEIMEHGDQADHADHADPFRVGALAGSGKTTVAIALIGSWYRSMIHSNGARYGRLLIPAFTRSAVAELSSRLSTFMTVEERRCLKIGTIDSLLRTLTRDAGFLTSGNLIRRGQELDLLNMLIGKKLAVMQEGSPRAIIAAGIDAVTAGRPHSKVLEQAGFSEAWDHLTAYATEKNCILEDGIREFVGRNIECITNCLQQHDDWGVTHMIIDEDQDCSRGDLSLAIELARRGGRVILLGDENQAIMGFRGGLGDVVGYLSSKNINVETVVCTTNFRSTAALVDAQNSLRGQNGMPGLPAKVPTGVSKGSPPAVIVMHDETAIMELACSLINGLMRGVDECDQKSVSGHDGLEGQLGILRDGKTDALMPNEIAILVPSNRIGVDLESALRERGLNVRFERSTSNPYRGDIAELAIAWTSGSNSENDFVLKVNQTLMITDALGKWSTSNDKKEFAMASMRFRRAFFLRVDDSSALGRDCVSIAMQCLEELLEEDALRRGAGQLKRLLESWVKGGEDVGKRLQVLVDVLPGLRFTPRTRGRDPGVAGRPDSLPAAFKVLARERRPAGETASVLERAATMYDQKILPEVDQREVVIRTIHRSKGLAFKAVIVFRSDLIGAGHASSCPEELSQDRCLVYVAASRATDEHYELALRKVNQFHSTQLDGWRYFDFGDIL